MRGHLEGMNARKLTLPAAAGELAVLWHATTTGKPYSAAPVSRLLARVASLITATRP